MRVKHRKKYIYLTLLGLALSSGPASAQLLFRDVTVSTGTVFDHTGPFGPTDRYMGTGAAWIDYDRDGDIDLYVTRRVGDNALFENQGDGTFVSIVGAAGAHDGSGDGAGVAVADFDNDGWRDMYLANGNEDALMYNTGGQFEDRAWNAQLLVSGYARGTSAAWGDYDRDGLVDLYLTNHSSLDLDFSKRFDFLFHNNGDGTFSNVTAYLPQDEIGGYGFIGAWTDVDDDGDSDIILINDCPIGPEPEALFRNDGSDGAGGWIFTSISADWGVDACDDAMGIGIGDYDRDGRMDFVYSNIGNIVLLHNEGNRLRDVAIKANIDVGYILAQNPQTRWTWGANFFDYDLDGWEDIYVASGANRSQFANMPNLLLHNQGDGTFVNVSETSGCDDPLRSRTSVFGDYDGDGDADIYVVNYIEPGSLYRNENDSGNRHLIVDLEGTASNRDGIGARVRIRTEDGAYQYREIRSGSSLGGGDDLAAYFGIGAHDGVEEVLIRWPSGVVQSAGPLAAGRHRIVEAGTTLLTRMDDVTVQQAGENFLIGWTTSFETGVEQFVVEKQDGDTYAAVATVPAVEPALRPQAHSVVVGGVRPGGHTFRVRADGGALEPVYSSPASIRVPSVSSLSRATPNPFGVSSRLTLIVASAGRVNVTAYDAVGRRVAELYDADAPAGAQIPLVFEARELPAGVYLIKASGPDFTIAEKVTLIR